jgi:hypothetical protein
LPAAAHAQARYPELVGFPARFSSSDIKTPASDTLASQSHITVATSPSQPGAPTEGATSMKTVKTIANGALELLFVALLFVVLSVDAPDARAQTADPPAAAPAKSDKAKKAADFAAKEKAMQDMSRSSASGAVASPTGTEATPYNKNKDAGKAAVDEALGIQTFKGSKPVDKNAKAVAPMKSLSKMTPEERAELRREVVKEAKP